MCKSVIKKAFILQIIVIINLLFLVGTSNAAIISVTTDQDLSRNVGQTSLRDAFNIASSNGVPDTIVLSSDINYVLDSCAAGPFTHSEDFSLTLQGNGASIQNVCVDGTGTIKNIGITSFTIENIEISGTAVAVDGASNGAAIRFEGAGSLVTIRDSDIHGFGGDSDIISAEGFPRAELVISNTRIHDNVGAAIRASHTALTMDNVTIARNTLAGISLVDGSPLSISNSFIKDNGRHGARTTGSGGGTVMKINNTEITGNGDLGVSCQQCADVEVIDSIISDNGTDPNGSLGGGGVAVVIANSGNATKTVIQRSTIKGNIARHPGGGLFIDVGSEGVDGNHMPQTNITESTFENNQSTCAGCDGGAIKVGIGVLSVVDSMITGNTAEGSGGGISQASNPILQDIAGSIFSLSNSQVGNNQSSVNGGGLYIEALDAKIGSSTIQGNTATGDGGGISIHSSKASIGSSSIQDNTAVGSGGGVISAGITRIFDDGGRGYDNGNTSIVGSTISGNTAAYGGGAAGESDASILTIENSTVVGNTAAMAGGGLSVNTFDVLNINHVTLVENAAPTGANLAASSSTSIARSIIAQPTGGGSNCSPYPGVSVFVSPVITSNGFSWFSDNTCKASTADTVDPSANLHLGPLADNGGPTLTRLPAITSPVVGLVPVTDCPVVGDQRETPRPSGIACEAGAVEIAEGMMYQLPDNQWHQISLPSNPGSNNNKVAHIFGDDDLGVLGTDWALFRYDTNTGGYIELQNNDELHQGIGYWVIQKTGSLKTLEMPSGSTPTLVTNPVGCLASASGCFEIQLAVKGSVTPWHLIGYPFNTASSLSDSRVLTGRGACSGGCELDIAVNEEVLHNQLWTYNGKSYDLVKGSDNLEPWRAYWSATLPGALESSPVNLLIPKP